MAPDNDVERVPFVLHVPGKEFRDHLETVASVKRCQFKAFVEWRFGEIGQAPALRTVGYRDCIQNETLVRRWIGVQSAEAGFDGL